MNVVNSQNPVQELLQEQGYPAPTPSESPAAGLPPGGGKTPIPHFATFAQIVNNITRTYRYTFDEARRQSDVNSLAMARDPLIHEALRTRQMPTAQLSWHLEAQNPLDQAQVAAVQKLTEIITAIPRFQQLKMSLLEALWFGRHGALITPEWDWSTGERRLVIRDHKPVNGDKLVFKWSGQAGILVNTMYEGDWSVTDRGRCHFFTPSEREQLIIHKFEPTDTDFFEGEMSGGIHGTGIRGRIYWLWWLRSQVQAWLMDYLERIGAGGFTIYFFEAGNLASMNEVQQAAQTQLTNNIILFPRYKDNGTGGPGIQRIEPSNAGAELLGNLITDYFDKIIRRYILGENISSEGAGLTVGSGPAELDAATFGRRIKYDAVDLQETLTVELVGILCKYNCPGVPCPRFVFDVDKPNTAEIMAAAKDFWEMGGSVDEDELRSLIGLAVPSPEHNVLSKLAPVQPAGIGGMPQGVPMEGQPGPEGPGQDQNIPPEGGPPQEQVQSQNQNPIVFQRQGQPLRFAAALQPFGPIADVAGAYLEGQGIPNEITDVPYEPVDPVQSQRIAQAYHNLRHAPMDPDVQSAYTAMIRETGQQFKHAQASGMTFEPWRKEGQPYANSTEMANDVRNNRHLYFFTGGELPKDHPLAGSAGNGLTHNDVFRAVHDYYGHALYGNQFGPRGEEHAWRVHSRMYTPLARRAMTTETRGQNSWVNFGPHGHLPVMERPYAEQKAGLLPTEFTEHRATVPSKHGFQRHGLRYAKDLFSGQDVTTDPSESRSSFDRISQQVQTTLSLRPPNNPFQHLPVERGPHPAPTQSAGSDPMDWLTGDEKAMLKTPKALDQFRSMYDRRPPIEDYVAASQAGHLNRRWYENSARMIHHLFPDNPRRMAKLIAATSPRTTVAANLQKALELWKIGQSFAHVPTDELRPEAVHALLTRLDEGLPVKGLSSKPKHLDVLGYNHPRVGGITGDYTTQSHLNNTIRAFKDMPLSGPKVGSFDPNVFGDTRYGTFDVHHSRFEGVPQAEYSRPPGYLASLVKARQAAASLNQRPEYKNDPWTVDQVQASVWQVAKALSERLLFDHTPGRTPEEKLHRITNKKAQAAGDFSTLLQSEKIEPLLADLGLTDKAQDVIRHVESRRPTEKVLNQRMTEGVRHDFGPMAARIARRTQEDAEKEIKSKERRGLRPVQEHPPVYQDTSEEYKDTEGMLREEPTPQPFNPHGRFQRQGQKQRYVQSGGGPEEAFGTAGGSESFTAFSPNEEEELDFPQAAQRVRSGNQAAFRKLTDHILQSVGVKQFKTFDAIGDWRDQNGQGGAENSVLQVIHGHPNTEDIDYAANWYGLLGRQKAVAVFHGSQHGPDSVYQIPVTETDTQRVRSSLDALGIQYRTIVPSNKGNTIVIIDEGRKLKSAVAKFAEEYNAPVREATGKGEFLGNGRTRTEARAAFRDKIRTLEARPGLAGGQRSSFQPRSFGRSPQVEQFSRRQRYAAVPERIAQAAFRIDAPTHPTHGKVFPTGPNHDLEKLPKGLYTDLLKNTDRGWNALQPGFLTTNGRFMGRHEADQFVGGEREHPQFGLTSEEILEQPQEDYAARKAPAGGQIVRGMYYPGGEMVPAQFSSRSMEKITEAAFLHTPTGDIYPTGQVHDMGSLPESLHPDIANSLVVSGFVTNRGKFLTREQAENRFGGGTSEEVFNRPRRFERDLPVGPGYTDSPPDNTLPPRTVSINHKKLPR